MENGHDELAWINAARTGDIRAFEHIVRRYESRVAATIKGMVGDTADVEDIGQEVFIRFYRTLDRYRGDASVYTYLTRIAINLSLNEIRRRRRGFLFGAGRNRDEEELEKRPDLGERPEELHRRNRVRQAIRTLPPRFRSVVVLRLIREHSTEETAAILNLPLGTVQSRLARAQKKLKDLLNPSAGRNP